MITALPSTLLSVQDLRIVRGERVILEAGTFALRRSERLALLGHNGAGKTTLLDVLSGHLKADEGRVWQAPGLQVGFLEQQAHFGPEVSVASLVQAAHPYEQAIATMRGLEQHLADAAVLHEYGLLQERLEHLQAYLWPARAARVLDILALTSLREREARTLSGGESTRLRLALALLQEGELLLLDEPTNHLDIRMREWLEQYLIQSGAACIITSHDREFLDKVAVRSLWLESGQLSSYPGGYSRAAALREQERAQRRKAARLSRRERGRLSGSAERLEVWGQRGHGLKSRMGRVPLAEMPPSERRMTMRLLSGQSAARVVVWARALSRSYAQRLVLSGVTFRVRQGDRIALLGANGAGKSTLLELLAGRLYPDTDIMSATVPDAPAPLTFAPGVSVAYLDQTWHGLQPDLGLAAQFEQRFGGRARALLGQAGFTAMDWAKTPRELSGGERSRAGLALVSALRSDVLLLDEPTNHLDIQALEALQAAVQGYSGAVIIVTHDRRFAREVATRVWQLEKGQLQELAGWGSRVTLDPDRSLTSDPSPPPPQTRKELLRQYEDRLLQIERELTGATQREVGRLRARRAQVQDELYTLYAEHYAAPSYDVLTPERGLKVAAQRLEAGGMFWELRNPECPHLAWDGACLRWSRTPPAWFAQRLLAGALRILFERWQVTRVQLGQGGPVLRRHTYFVLERAISAQRSEAP